VRREIVSRFKGVPMRIVGRPMTNALGPFGLAIGAGPGGLRCAYAWQWLDNFTAAARGERSTFFNSGDMPASIRMRVCRRGLTVDQLAGWYEQLTVTDMAHVTRIVEAIPREAPVDVASNGAGASLVDSSDSLEATLIGGASPSAAAPRRSARHAAYAGRRRHGAASAAPEAPAPYAPHFAPVSPSADGRQYLAPPAGAPAARLPGVVRTGAPPIDPSLPARAYRGPSAARAITPPPGGAPQYLAPATR
ncbi:MAG: cellulose biosynthesis protein BcsN, partial [Methylocystis sp.]|nr:cellulose biosynthesis protein BcsN [Methylocystis sp.]